jgi:MinD-like ATPase involved in chromosome partitioning or flagellar assembly
MVLNADLSFPSINFLAALKLSPIKADARQQEMQAEKPLPAIELITVDTDITVLACPWPEEHNPIVDEITSGCHQADVILINTSTGFSSNARALFKAADEILLISGFEPAHLIDTYSIIKTIHQFTPEAHIGIIIMGEQAAAQAGFKKLQEVSQQFLKLHDAAQEFLGISLYWYGFIPWDDEVMNSTIRKAPFLQGSAGEHAVHNIGEMLLNTQAQWQRALDKQEPGFIEKLFIANGQAISWEKRYQRLTRHQAP